jgi:hypothetical protein
MPPHVHIDFVFPPPGCGRSVTDFWAWGAHRARLRCPDDVSDDGTCERGVPGGALHLNSTSYPDHGRCGDFPLQGKIPTAEPGIEPGTSWLLARSSDHQTTRLVKYITAELCICLYWKGLLIHVEFTDLLTDAVWRNSLVKLRYLIRHLDNRIHYFKNRGVHDHVLHN